MARIGIALAMCLLAVTTFAQEPTSRHQSNVPGGIYHEAIPAKSALPPSAWASWSALKNWGGHFVRKGLPGDGLSLAIGLLTTSCLVIAGCRNRMKGVLLAALLVGPAIPLTGLVPMQFFGNDLNRRAAFTLAFTSLYVATAIWAIVGWLGARRPEGTPWRPPIPESWAKMAAGVAVACALTATAVRTPDDCGVYSNLGAQRWIETGTLPYGDSALRGGAAATYGPVLYGLHALAQLAVSGGATFPNAADARPMDTSRYVRPDMGATKWVAALSLIGVCVGLFIAARRMADTATAWLMVTLFASSAYVLGLGGRDAAICGVGYVSHLTPAAFVALAMASLNRPWLAGMLMALGAGTVYWPAFLVPLWIGHYFGRNRRAALSYVAGFAATGLVLAAWVILSTKTAPGESAVGLFFRSTLEHQEGMDQYGSSPFSFWGVHPDLASSWHHPLFSFGGSLTKPTFLLVVITSVLGLWAGYRSRDGRLAALSAAMPCVVQLWKTHAGGSYVEWALPMLLLALLADRGDTRPDAITSP